MKEQLEEICRDYNKLEKELSIKNREINEKIKSLQREQRISLHKEYGIILLEEQLQKVSQDIAAPLKEVIKKYFEECYYDSEGILSLVKDKDDNHRLIRLKPVGNVKMRFPISIVLRSEIYKLEDYVLLEKFKNYYEIMEFIEQKKYIEVKFSATIEDLKNNSKILLESNWPLCKIIKTFPKEWKPTLTPGQILPFGSCSHHSGDIVGKQIVLPTMKLAIISDYRGEHGNHDNLLWGITEDYNLEPQWSAKERSWCGCDLDELTEEEKTFFFALIAIRVPQPLPKFI